MTMQRGSVVSFLLTSKRQRVTAEVVKANTHTIIVRLPGGNVIKRHIRKHGVVEAGR